jgi:hypothetical protein
VTKTLAIYQFAPQPVEFDNPVDRPQQILCRA